MKELITKFRTVAHKNMGDGYQRKIAEKLGKHRSAITRALNGKHNPSLCLFLQMMAAAEVTFKDLDVV